MLKTIGEYEYNTDDSLGSGTFATVYRGKHHKTGKTVAVKAVDLRRIAQSPNEDKYLDSEIRIMLSLRHPNIVQLEDVIRTDSMMYLVLEFCGGGDFATFIRGRKRLPERQAQYFMRHLSLGLKSLHTKGIVHRDLKPHNLLLSDKSDAPVLKIADFGFARMMDSAQLATTICGSPLYMAPEVLSCQRYTDKADLWSVGTIFYEMLVGSPPFRARNPVELNEMIHRVAAVKLPADVQVSAECSKLVTSLLTVSTDLRISWDDFLRHPWLSLEESPRLEGRQQKQPPPPPLVVSTGPNGAQRHQPRGLLSPIGPAEAVALEGSSSSAGTGSSIERDLVVVGANTPTPDAAAAAVPVTVAAAIVAASTAANRGVGVGNSGGVLMSPPLQARPSEKLTEELRNWLRMATAVMALADLKVDSDYVAEGFALFVHGLSVIRAALLTAQRRVASDGIPTNPADPQLRDAVDALREKLGECLNKAEKARTGLAAFEATVVPEKVAFEYALFLSKEGAMAEQMAQREKALHSYETALALFESIVPSVLDKDKDVVRKYISLLKKRVVATTRI